MAMTPSGMETDDEYMEDSSDDEKKERRLYVSADRAAGDVAADRVTSMPKSQPVQPMLTQAELEGLTAPTAQEKAAAVYPFNSDPIDSPTFGLDISRQDVETEQDKRARAYADAGGRGSKNSRVVPDDVLSGEATYVGTAPESPGNAIKVLEARNLLGVGGGTPTDYNVLNQADFMHSLFGRLVEQQKNIEAAGARYDKKMDLLEADKAAAEIQHIQNIGLEGQANASVWMAQAAVEAKLGNDAARNLADLGMGPEDKDRVITEMMTRQRDVVYQMTQKRAEISQKEAQIPSLMTNPLGHIIGQMGMKKDIEDYNNLNGQRLQLQQGIEGLTNSYEKITHAQAARHSVDSAAKSVAAANLAVATATRQQSEANKSAIASSATYAGRELQASIRQFELINSTIGIMEKVDTMEAKAQVLALKKAADAEILKAANTARKAAGYPELPSIEAFNRMPKEEKEQLLVMMDSGGNKWGLTLTDAMQNVGRGDPRRQSAETTYIYGLTKKMLEKVDDTLSRDPLYAGQKKEIKQQRREAGIQSGFDELEKDVFHQLGDKPNPMRAPTLKIMLENETIANSHLGQLMKQARELNPKYEPNDRVVVGAAFEEMKRNPAYTIERAVADTNNWFRYAIEHNNNTWRYEAWGLHEQRTYRFDGTNWVNPQATTLQFAKRWAAQIAEMSGFSPFGEFQSLQPGMNPILPGVRGIPEEDVSTPAQQVVPTASPPGMPRVM